MEMLLVIDFFVKLEACYLDAQHIFRYFIVGEQACGGSSLEC